MPYSFSHTMPYSHIRTASNSLTTQKNRSIRSSRIEQIFRSEFCFLTVAHAEYELVREC